jgi:hypothetical protein
MNDGADGTGGDVFGGMVAAHAPASCSRITAASSRTGSRGGGADDASSTIQIVRCVPFAPFGPTTSTSTE